MKDELEKLKTDKRLKNECIIIRNTDLVNKLQEENEEKLQILDEMIDETSEFNLMNDDRRKEWLQTKRKSITEYNKSPVNNCKSRSMDLEDHV